ncbi:hypothetical protein PI27_gp019 [Listeria phage WIL-1]|nr:hypothetical protein PI27_gp019 [Listeria phage WIL-1]
MRNLINLFQTVVLLIDWKLNE